jgi:hypothetical protein
MSRSYVIQWKSTVNGRAGKGTKLFGLEEAQSLAEELNREYPGIHHQVIEAGSTGEGMDSGGRRELAEPLEIAEEAETAAEIPEKTHPDYAFSA